MDLSQLDKPVQFLKGVGPRRSEALARMGILSARDLLFHVPRRYDDASTVHPIAGMEVGMEATAVGRVKSSGVIPTRSGLRIFQAVLQDETGMKLSKSQMQDLVKLILGKTKAELLELANNDDLPFWVSLIANKASRDYKKGSMHVLELLFDRVYGKPKEEVQNKNSGSITIKFEPLGPKKSEE